MKVTIHPKKQQVIVLMSDGRTYVSNHTFLKHKKQSILLELDSANHPVWNKTQQLNVVGTNIRINKFNKRFKQTTHLHNI